MKAYFLLAIGASWLAVAIVGAFNSFAIGFQPGALNPFASAIVLSALMLLFFLGWIAPRLLGALAFTEKTETNQRSSKMSHYLPIPKLDRYRFCSLLDTKACRP